jgi:hypothetical protein
MNMSLPSSVTKRETNKKPEGSRQEAEFFCFIEPLGVITVTI